MQQIRDRRNTDLKLLFRYPPDNKITVMISKLVVAYFLFRNMDSAATFNRALILCLNFISEYRLTGAT